MATVTHDDLWFCSDCTMGACNGDFSGMDDETEKRVRAALAALPGYACPDFDAETEAGIESFSWRRCDCCKSTLGGERTRFCILDGAIE